jgi:hypothetical protein
MRIGAAALALAVGCTCLAGCASLPSEDEKLAARLVGKWSRVLELEQGRVEDATELSGDGTLRVNGVLHSAAGSRRFSATGSWRVQEGRYLQRIDSSDFPGWRPAGSEPARPIVSVSEWEWVMTENPAGKERRAWRFPK